MGMGRLAGSMGFRMRTVGGLAHSSMTMPMCGDQGTSCSARTFDEAPRSTVARMPNVPGHNNRSS
eukprot:4606242-Pyramimonas_sp.AAC.1